MSAFPMTLCVFDGRNGVVEMKDASCFGRKTDRDAVPRILCRTCRTGFWVV